MPKATPATVAPHGTGHMAQLCREECEPCTAYRDRLGHGRALTYFCGCRCDECQAEESWRKNGQYARRKAGV